jgi:nucleotidyltransferase substrate binding protein (TIGR01987 family)
MDKRLELKLKQFEKALLTLKDVLAQPKNQYIRDSAIKRFEYCFELFWKVLRIYFLTEKGEDYKSPKDAMRGLRVFDFLTPEETEKALKMVDDRNLSVHTYDELEVEQLYGRVFGYYGLMEGIYKKIEEGK